MHRSGTSAVSRVINLLGVSLGDERDLVAPMRDNPRGFWESLPLIRFAEGFLLERGGSWLDPPVLADGWQDDDDVAAARSRASAVLEPLLASGDVVGWKDPRSSLLLPFWRTVTEVDRTVLVIRDPRDVAGSLAKRNGFGAERSAYLWLRYNVAAWRNDPGRRLVNYEALVRAPEPTVRSLAEACGLPVPDDERASEIAAEIVAEFNHEHHVPIGPTMRLAVQYYDLCMAGHPKDVDAATEDLHHRWLGAGANDDRLRKVRRAVRVLVPPQLRRRLRANVGGVASLPVRKATKPARPIAGFAPSVTEASRSARPVG